MNRFAKERAIAESFLDEMFEAERLRDFEAWSRQWDEGALGGLNNEVFQSDLEKMNDVLGKYKSREYLGVVESMVRENSRSNTASRRQKFVWRVNYEKNEALQVVGLKKTDGEWRAYRNS